jgi:hypothetical protein
MQSLAEIKQEISLLVEYTAPPEQRPEAMRLVDRYETDIIALRLFHHFYSFLPEAQEDAIRILRLLARRQGTFLLCATTTIDNYLYLVNSEQAEFAGTLAAGLEDAEVMNFFDIAGQIDFRKRFSDLDQLPDYVPALLDDRLCPICLVEDGECHTVGCPVEVCPWCGGQLISCQCRFTQLGQARLTTEGQINDLLEKLEKKGRLPFNAEEDRPSYPDPADLMSRRDD